MARGRSRSQSPSNRRNSGQKSGRGRGRGRRGGFQQVARDFGTVFNARDSGRKKSSRSRSRSPNRQNASTSNSGFSERGRTSDRFTKALRAVPGAGAPGIIGVYTAVARNDVVVKKGCSFMSDVGGERASLNIDQADGYEELGTIRNLESVKLVFDRVALSGMVGYLRFVLVKGKTAAEPFYSKDGLRKDPRANCFEFARLPASHIIKIPDEIKKVTLADDADNSWRVIMVTEVLRAPAGLESSKILGVEVQWLITVQGV